MLRFLRVFGDIAVTASGEEMHCAALYREWQELLFALPQDGSSVYEGLITGPKQEPTLLRNRNAGSELS